MNRTAPVGFACCLLLLSALRAQNPPAPKTAPAPAAAPESRAKAGPLDEVVRAMRAAEAKARAVRLELSTEGAMQGGLKVVTTGSIRVLRTEQGALQAAHVVLACTFGDGVESRMESVKTPDGLWVAEQNPTIGEVLLHYDRDLLADLDWAGEVLQRSDVPGRDSRVSAPLGSEVVADLAQRYELAPMKSRERAGQAGTWYGGDRKPGPGQDEDGDLPIVDHVELFLRAPDQALLEVVYLQQGKPVQRVRVDQCVVGEVMPIESFALDLKGRKPKEVRDYPPEWEQVQQLLQSAREKAAGKLPPSEQKKSEAKGDKQDGKGDGK